MPNQFGMCQEILAHAEVIRHVPILLGTYRSMGGSPGIPMGGIPKPLGSMGTPGVGTLRSWASGNRVPNGEPRGVLSILGSPFMVLGSETVLIRTLY